jgi:hypothetical protein
MARGYISADLKDWLNALASGIYKSFLGTIIKEAHNGAGSSHSRVALVEDFLGSALDTSKYKATVVATAVSAALKADEARGVVVLGLEATTEVQASRLDFGDQLCIGNADKPYFEAYLEYNGTASEEAGVSAGLSGDYAAAFAQTIAANFLIADSGTAITLSVRTDDGVTDSGVVLTDYTIVAGTKYLFKVDVSIPTNVKFYVNGVRVAAQTSFDMSGYAGNLQSAVCIEKIVTSASAGTVELDFVRIESNRA